MRFRGIRLDISEIQIQRQEYSVLCMAAFGQLRVFSPRQFLIGDSIRLVARFAKDRGVLRRKIFVDFEFQALVSSGRSTVPSRANSAA